MGVNGKGNGKGKGKARAMSDDEEDSPADDLCGNASSSSALRNLSASTSRVGLDDDGEDEE